ncbi:MAG: ribbon-helix-helix domain-containing protein [Nanoarchaeota archaeon]
METISLKLDSSMKKAMSEVMRKFHYATQTEFVRQALRDKISQLEKENMLAHLKKMPLSSRKTTDEELHKARENLSERLMKKLEVK